MTDDDRLTCIRYLAHALTWLRQAEASGPNTREFRAGIVQAELGISLADDIAKHGAPSSDVMRQIAGGAP